jgi:hypothetical protein
MRRPNRRTGSEQAFRDPETHAIYVNGVIYTGAFDKGEVCPLVRLSLARAHGARCRHPQVLDRFLGNGIYPATRPAASRSMPSLIVFIDDRVSNVESVMATRFARRHGIPVHARGALEGRATG